MKLSYIIGACTEDRELFNLLTFLSEFRNPEHEVVVVLDSNHVTQNVRDVTEKFDWVKTVEQPFEGDFATYKNNFSKFCDGEYIFNIDADEIPQEFLVHMVNKIINDDNPPDLIAVPRINIYPGYTQSFLKKHSFSCNQMGWINWPDYQGRVYRRELLWGGKVHERIQGATRPTTINADPTYSLWHVKSTTKQDSQDELYDQIIKA